MTVKSGEPVLIIWNWNIRDELKRRHVSSKKNQKKSHFDRLHLIVNLIRIFFALYLLS